MTLYILKYNNYYNRMVKKEDSLVDYQPYITYTLPNVNFNPNDHVNTQHVIGVGDYDGTGDYVLVAEGNDILSRWFIVESQRQRGGQWTITLRRDVVVDYKNLILSAPCFIEKATVNNSDPAIFNNEDMNFNQVKVNEILLENELKTPWVVGYLSRYKADGGYNSYNVTFKREGYPETDYTFNSLSEYPFYKYKDVELIYSPSIHFGTCYINAERADAVYYEYCYKDGSTYGFEFDAAVDYPNLPTASRRIVYSNWRTSFSTLNRIYSTYNVVDASGMAKNSLTGWYDLASQQKFMLEGNKTIRVGNKFYQVSTKSYTSFGDEVGYDGPGGIEIKSGTDLYTKMNELLVTPYLNTTGKTIRNVVSAAGGGSTYGKILLEINEISMTTNNINLQFGYNGAATVDAEYEIIATPLKNVTFTINSTGSTFNHVGLYGLQAIQAIAQKYYGANQCYDIQIVPYCPIDTKDVSYYVANNYTAYVTESGTQATYNRAIIFKLQTSSFNQRKLFSLDLNDDYKIGNLTELYRLTSPNGIGNFDFNPYKNGGFSGYEVDCTLLPYNPYIKINPFFNSFNGEQNLYGGDYNDFRGLICGGDFSLSITSNQWETYAINNKYYQQIFDRQIENISTNNAVQKEKEYWSGVTGMVGSMFSGAGAGALVGGIPGAVVGAVGGLTTSGVGFAMDQKYNSLLRYEALDYTKDMYSYNLQTIQARPNTLSRTTAYNINNKYFPYIEIFKCTETEIKALQDKIKYNGMTIMRIGSIQDFIQPEPSYIKAKLIRLENVNEDYHIINAISGELDKGVFI